MQISPNGVAFIRRHEGLKLHAYLDSAGVPTIGYGTTHYPGGAAVKLRDVVTAAQAETYFQFDLQPLVLTVARMVTHALTQNQFDALVSFAYNEGAPRLKGSTLLRYVNAGNFPAAADQFTLWDKAHVDGRLVEVPGLLTRRQDERALFLGD